MGTGDRNLPRGVDRDGDRADGRDRVHERAIIVGGQALVSGDAGDGRRRVAHAVARVVRIVRARREADAERVVEGQPLRRAGAPSRAATVLGIRRTVDVLLRREDGQGAGGDSDGGLDGLSRRERPARAARLLVLHRRHHALLAPVDRVRQISPRRAAEQTASAARFDSPFGGRADVLEALERAPFLLSPIAVRGEAHLPRGARVLIVLANGRQRILEDAPARVVRRADVRLPVLRQILVERVLVLPSAKLLPGGLLLRRRREGEERRGEQEEPAQAHGRMARYGGRSAWGWRTLKRSL